MDSPQRLLVSFPVAADRIGDFDPGGRYHRIGFHFHWRSVSGHFIPVIRDGEHGAVFAAVVDVVWLIRLPRLLLAVAVGMGLSICGVIMQAIVKNPLADPYVLGVSSGASLGATAGDHARIRLLFGR